MARCLLRRQELPAHLAKSCSRGIHTERWRMELEICRVTLPAASTLTICFGFELGKDSLEKDALNSSKSRRSPSPRGCSSSEEFLSDRRASFRPLPLCPPCSQRFLLAQQEGPRPPSGLGSMVDSTCRLALTTLFSLVLPPPLALRPWQPQHFQLIGKFCHRQR